MNKKIIIFSKFFGYNVGGAERSMFELLKQKEKEGYEINVLFVDNVKTFNAQNLKMQFPRTWNIFHINFKTDTLRFYYFQYFINKSIIEKLFKNLDTSYELWSYGLYAPAAINAYKGKSVYFVRDEFGLGWNNNYFVGIKKYIKELYRIIDYPFYLKWKKELYKAVKKADLIANSKFIAEELEKISGKKVKVIYPYVNEKELLHKWENINFEGIEKGIVCIGDNIFKGSDIVKKLAKEFPNEKFYIFDRKYKEIIKENNIIYMPWQKDSIDVYKYAKLVLIPSRCHEAYPRVAKEAKILNIPAIGSARGGIVEILDNSMLVHNIDDIEEWKVKIKQILES